MKGGLRRGLTVGVNERNADADACGWVLRVRTCVRFGRCRAQVMQIYNDNVFDLLADKRMQRPLKVREGRGPAQSARGRRALGSLVVRAVAGAA